MGNKLFDNIMKIIQAAVVFTGATLVSLEVDLELPRGFVARIHQVELRFDRLGEDFETVSADQLARLRMALILDPDDTNAISHTSNRVDHDILADLEITLMQVGGSAGDPGWLLPENMSKQIIFSGQGVDVITARNMRLNAQAEGGVAANITESFGIAIIYYTLEEVKDADILQLLDIL